MTTDFPARTTVPRPAGRRASGAEPAVRRLTPAFTPALAERAAIGLLMLANDATIEAEWRDLLAVDGVRFYAGRVACEPVISPDALRRTERRLAAAAATLVPDCPLDVLVYACTSAALMIGEPAVDAALRAARPGAAATTPLSAVKTALGALGARRIALLTPYTDAINRPLCRCLGEAGFALTAAGSFYVDADPDVARIAPDAIADATRRLAADERPDAVLIACTALRAAALVEDLEGELGCAVTTSGHALAWHALRLAGVDEFLPGRGRLFRL